MNIYGCTKDCPNRSIEPNCHMTCKIYLDAVKLNKEKNEALNKIRNNYREEYYSLNGNQAIKKKGKR